MSPRAVERERIWAASLAAAGYRVIDWRRPIRAPAEIGRVALLAGEGIDLRGFVGAPVVGVHWLLFLYWAAEAQFVLFSDFRGPLRTQFGVSPTKSRY